MCMVREWQHIKLLKCMHHQSPKDLAGSSSAEGMTFAPGSLAVQCLACPWPGLNMPDGWETETEKP